MYPMMSQKSAHFSQRMNTASLKTAWMRFLSSDRDRRQATGDRRQATGDRRQAIILTI